LTNFHGNIELERLANDAMADSNTMKGNNMSNINDNNSPCVTTEDNASIAAALDAVSIERDDLLKEVKDLTERHAHMSNIALGARADVHQTRRDLDEANKDVEHFKAKAEEWREIAKAQSRRATCEIDQLRARNRALEIALVQLTLKLSAQEHVRDQEERIRDIEAAGHDVGNDDWHEDEEDIGHDPRWTF